MQNEECASCAYWERRGGGWGRCWAPESNGNELGIQLITEDPAMLTTHGTFSCSAWTPQDDEESDGFGDFDE
jgi:hypothetical protein